MEKQIETLNAEEILQDANKENKNKEYSTSIFIVTNEETAILIKSKYNLQAITTESKLYKTYKSIAATTIILLNDATPEALARNTTQREALLEEATDFIDYTDYIELLEATGEIPEKFKTIIENYNSNFKSYQYRISKEGITIAKLIEANPNATESFLIKLAKKAEEEKSKEYSINLDQFKANIQSNLYEPEETLAELNEATEGGFLKQSLIGIGGTSSTGKTTFALQIALALAEKRKQVLYLTLETSPDFLIAKLLSNYIYKTTGETLTAAEIIQAYKLEEKKRKKLEKALEAFKDIAKYIILIYPEELTLSYIKRNIEKITYRMQSKPILFIDYIQFIIPEGKEDATATLKKANKYFKNYAIKNNTLAFFLAAFNKEAENKGKDTLNNIRDTSDIGYTSDYFISLLYEAEEETKEAEPTIIASFTKNRLRKSKNRNKIQTKRSSKYFYKTKWKEKRGRNSRRNKKKNRKNAKCRTWRSKRTKRRGSIEQVFIIRIAGSFRNRASFFIVYGN